MKTLRVAIRSRWMDNGVYVRKEDLLKWLDSEAAALREEGLDDAAIQTESIAEAVRKVRAS